MGVVDVGGTAVSVTDRVVDVGDQSVAVAAAGRPRET